MSTFIFSTQTYKTELADLGGSGKRESENISFQMTSWKRGKFEI
jgi:hypothetical protein